MLDNLHRTPPPTEVVDAPSLVAGEWVTDRPHADRVGPWVRGIVSTARKRGLPLIMRA